ncbi:ORF6N domain-containing protein [Pseudoduganella guangdongensis]|uniref:ORF6N domain-containing protein n=1 Tax=Pseudoduganella guangdongensis TaxID=2692179 RepID=UPI001E33300C|nr:ORF6N domain-containing protein [Pseudoduganella guangdongensis]
MSAPAIPLASIENRILLIRGQKVMIDADLAELYGVPTKRLNEQLTSSPTSASDRRLRGKEGDSCCATTSSGLA